MILIFDISYMPFQIIIHVVTLIFALFFLVGFKTRASNILLWLLVLSLHNRNVLILNSGDDLLRMLLFWSIFMPVGDRFSLDSANQSSIPQCISSPRHCFITSTFLSSLWLLISFLAANRYLSLASACYILQLAAVFWVGYLLKTGVKNKKKNKIK